MIKTVTLTGSETTVSGLQGFNTAVHNLGEGTIYASKYPNITAGADNVAEIPAGSAKLISTTNGTVYLLGSGKAELTGQDSDLVNFKQPSSRGGGGSTSDVTKEYVDSQTDNALSEAKAYTDTHTGTLETNISALAESVTAAQTAAANAQTAASNAQTAAANAQTVAAAANELAESAEWDTELNTAELDTHITRSVCSKAGIHDLRYYEGALQIKQNNTWVNLL